MDRRELLDGIEPALRAALQGWQATVYTALPGIVDSFDPAKMTCTVQPALMAKATNADGSVTWVQLPLLLDVPVVFPGGGGFTLTFPVKQGDEALVVFASRCIDDWYAAGGVQEQRELRMHDLSDGFAFVGVRSQPRVLAGVNTTGAQLRSDDGATYVEVDAGTVKATAPTSITATAPQVNVTASTKVEITSPLVHCSGALTVDGLITGNAGAAITGTMNNNGKDIGSGHKHSGVQTGAGQTGVPI